MTDKERDDKIEKIYDICLRMEPMVESHNATLYGNGQPGLKEDVALLKQTQKNCPARIASTTEGRQLTVAQVMMVIVIIGLIVNAVLAAAKLVGS